MQTTNKKPKYIPTGEVILSYPRLFEGHAFNQGDKEKFSTIILIDKSDVETIKTIEASFNEVIAKEFANKPKPVYINTILKDGDTELNDEGVLRKEKNPELAGKMYMRLASQYKPNTIDAQGNKIEDKELVYAGVIARVSFTPYYYSQGANRGVSAYLRNVMIVRDGERLAPESMAVGSEFGIEVYEVYEEELPF